MQYTPFGGLTEDELVMDVLNDDTSTERELELVLRIERLQAQLMWYRQEMSIQDSVEWSVSARNLRAMPA